MIARNRDSVEVHETVSLNLGAGDEDVSARAYVLVEGGAAYLEGEIELHIRGEWVEVHALDRPLRVRERLTDALCEAAHEGGGG